MIVLAVDTARDACQAALFDSASGRLVLRRVEMARGHAEALMPMIAEVVAESSLAVDRIDCFAATIGPGTFTGVRVGVAAVRGLALAAAKPAVGITTLEALAASARMAGVSGPLLVALDARRGEVYAQSFAGDDSLLSEPVAAPAAKVIAALPEGVVQVFGSGAPACAESAAAAGISLQVAGLDSAPRIEAVARLALAAPAGAPRPFYLRPPDAKPQNVAGIARR